MSTKNICKFVTPKEHGHLVAVDFIYESLVPHSGETRTFGTHTLNLVVSGKGYFSCTSQHHRLSTGAMFFTFADIPFKIENTDGLTYYYISFSGSRSDELMNRFSITPANSFFKGYEGLIPFFKDSLTRANEQNIDLLSESILLYAFSKLNAAEKNKNDVVVLLLQYMEENFTDCSLSLGSAAKAIGYNAKYLSHLFKQQYGIGFSEHLTLLRVKHAVMLLENGVTSVKNVAALSGFSDPLYFSKVFRNIIGVSPGQYHK